MSELLCLKLGLLLWLAHLLTQAAFAGQAFDLAYLGTARDDQRAPKGVHHPRATRAFHNYIENFVPFVAADLGLIVANHTGGWGATLWIVCRIIYLPLYVAGVNLWRSVAWTVSLVGLLMMFWRLI
jgi:uncharacterized MAPEG superfamily protein